MTEELKEYIHRHYYNLKSEEETKLLNKLHDYSNWLRLAKNHGLEIAKDYHKSLKTYRNNVLVLHTYHSNLHTYRQNLREY